MIVTLDGRRLEREFAPGCMLAALLDDVRSIQLDERLLVSVAVNGRRYDERELETGLAQPLDPGDQVDLESGDRYAISADALRALAADLVESARIQPELAQRLSTGEAAGAIREIGRLVEVWQQCRIVIVQCSGLLGRDLTRETLAGRSVEEGLTELVEKLRALRDALEARDLVLLADLLNYEMPALCETWHDLLTSLAAGIEESAKARSGPAAPGAQHVARRAPK